MQRKQIFKSIRIMNKDAVCFPHHFAPRSWPKRLQAVILLSYDQSIEPEQAKSICSTWMFDGKTHHVKTQDVFVKIHENTM